MKLTDNASSRFMLGIYAGLFKKPLKALKIHNIFSYFASGVSYPVITPNKVESANRFAKAIFFGNNQEIEYAAREEQEIAESCKRLIENSIICWNYIYLSQKLSDIDDKKDKDKMIDIIKSGSIVFWRHINLLGEYNFSEEIMNKKLEFDIPKILELKVA